MYSDSEQDDDEDHGDKAGSVAAGEGTRLHGHDASEGGGHHATRGDGGEEGLLAPVEPGADAGKHDKEGPADEGEDADDDESLGPEAGEVVDADTGGEQHVDAGDQPDRDGFLQVVDALALGEADVADGDGHQDHRYEAGLVGQGLGRGEGGDGGANDEERHLASTQPLHEA